MELLSFFYQNDGIIQSDSEVNRQLFTRLVMAPSEFRGEPLSVLKTGDQGSILLLLLHDELIENLK